MGPNRRRGLRRLRSRYGGGMMADSGERAPIDDDSGSDDDDGIDLVSLGDSRGGDYRGTGAGFVIEHGDEDYFASPMTDASEPGPGFDGDGAGGDEGEYGYEDEDGRADEDDYGGIDEDEDEDEDMPEEEEEPSTRLCTPLSSADLVEMSAIGRGQHGRVVRALHLPSLCMLAVKRINAYSIGARQQLLKELMAYSRLSSPSIVPLLGAFFEEGSIVLASEYMDLGDLKRFVSRVGPLSGHLLRHVARRALEGLDYLHSSYQVHRDVKPDNILVDHRGNIKISDFGLLKELDDTMSVTTSFLGTLTYLSPERLTSLPYSYPSDVWAMGLVFVFCATGRPAFLTSDYWKLFDHVVTENAAASILTPAAHGPLLCDLVAQMLARDPAQRPTARALLHHPYFSEPTALREHTPEYDAFVEQTFGAAFTDSMAAAAAQDEYLRAVDIVIDAHFHGILRVPRSAIASDLALKLGLPPIQPPAPAAKPGRGHGRKAPREPDADATGIDGEGNVESGGHAAKVRKRAGDPDAASGATGEVEVDDSTSSDNESEPSAAAAPAEAEAEGEGEYVWVQGYRPLLPEDQERCQRVSDLYNLPVATVRAAFEAALARKQEEAGNAEILKCLGLFTPGGDAAGGAEFSSDAAAATAAAATVSTVAATRGDALPSKLVFGSSSSGGGGDGDGSTPRLRRRIRDEEPVSSPADPSDPSSLALSPPEMMSECTPPLPPPPLPPAGPEPAVPSDVSPLPHSE
jgi:hypothetical protein